MGGTVAASVAMDALNGLVVVTLNFIGLALIYFYALWWILKHWKLNVTS